MLLLTIFAGVIAKPQSVASNNAVTVILVCMKSVRGTNIPQGFWSYRAKISSDHGMLWGFWSGADSFPGVQSGAKYHLASGINVMYM